MSNLPYLWLSIALMLFNLQIHESFGLDGLNYWVNLRNEFTQGAVIVTCDVSSNWKTCESSIHVFFICHLFVAFQRGMQMREALVYIIYANLWMHLPGECSEVNCGISIACFMALCVEFCMSKSNILFASLYVLVPYLLCMNLCHMSLGVFYRSRRMMLCCDHIPQGTC